MKIIVIICGIAIFASGNNTPENLDSSWLQKICQAYSWGSTLGKVCPTSDNLSIQICSSFLATQTTGNHSVMLSMIRGINKDKLALCENPLQLGYFTKILEFIVDNEIDLKPDDIVEITRLLDTLLGLSASTWWKANELLSTTQSITTSYRKILANAGLIELNERRIAILKMKLHQELQGVLATLSTKANPNGTLRMLSKEENVSTLTEHDVVIILPEFITNNPAYWNNVIIWEFYNGNNLFLTNRDQKEEKTAILVPDNENVLENNMIASLWITANDSNIDMWINDGTAIIVKFKYKSDKYEDYGCLYWDMGFNLYAELQCKFYERTPTCIICHCHAPGTYTFTNELGSYLETEYDSFDVIRLVGSSISLPALAINIVTFIRFKEWRKDVHHKTMHSMSLAIFLNIFTSIIEDFRPFKIICITIMAIQHFCSLAAITWVLADAIILYREISKKSTKGCMIWANIMAWGLPLITVGTILSINHDWYTSYSRASCRMATFVQGFGYIVPATCVGFINFILIFLIMGRVCTRGRAKPKTVLSQNSKAAYSSLTLFVILWTCFWIGAIKKDDISWWHIAYAVLASLEGFLVFLLNVIGDSHAFKTLWLNKGRNEEQVTIEETEQELKVRVGKEQILEREEAMKKKQQTGENEMDVVYFIESR